MRLDLIQEVYDWNNERDLIGDRIDVDLEYTMIKEELLELLGAPTRVDVADALGDIIWVALGSLSKLTQDVDKVSDIMLAISAANNTKGKDTASGKITKPIDFVGPESMIEKVLYAS